MKSHPPIETLILTIRHQKVILDTDLASLYGVATRVLNQAVKRNKLRFPTDFVFQLTPLEWQNLKSHFATSTSTPEKDSSHAEVSSLTSPLTLTSPLKSQLVTSSHGGKRKLPYAFTEHGAIMAATVLNSKPAVAMSVYIVRAFIHMREQLATNTTVLKRLAEMDKTLLQHDTALRDLYQKLLPLLQPTLPPGPKRKIGFS